MENLLAALHEQEIKLGEINVEDSLLSALKETEKNRGTVSKSLNINPLNLDEYKKRVEKNVADRLGRLTVSQKAGEGILNEIIKRWHRCKGKIMGKVIHFVFRHYYNLLSKLFELMKKDNAPSTQQSLLDKLKGGAITFVNEQLGLNTILKKFGAQSEIVFYYMMDKITEEIDQIISSPAITEPVQEGEQEVSLLKKAVNEFTDPKNPILSEALKNELKPFMDLLQQQGNPNSLRDVVTPIGHVVLPQWQAWLKGEPEVPAL